MIKETLQQSVNDYNLWASRESGKYMSEYTMMSNHNNFKGIFYNKLIGNLLRNDALYLKVTCRKELLRAISTHDLICIFELGGFLSKLMIPRISAQDSIRHIHGRVLLINVLWDSLESITYTRNPAYQGEMNDIVNSLDKYHERARNAGTG